MGDSRDKRPGVFVDDEARAEAELERRKRERALAPAEGIPIFAVSEDDFTPITDVIAMAKTDSEAALIKRLWRKMRNSEMRQARRIQLTEGGQLREDLEDLRAAVIAAFADIRGESGDNGKLGELRRRVDAWTSKMWWFVTSLVGGFLAAAVKLVFVVRAFDAVEARSLVNERAVDELKQQNMLLQAQVTTLQSAALGRRSHRGEPGPSLEAEGKEP